MKKALTIILSFLFTGSVFGQLQQFDSSYILASSSIYDYHNFCFERPSFFFIDSLNMAYERSNGSSSNIISRRTLGGVIRDEILLTNDNFININPATSKNMVVWQSNKYGNYDIFFSSYNGTAWSAPIICDTSSSTTESNPKVVESFSSTPPYQCLVYQKDNDIILRTYSNGVKFIDTNLTLTDNNPASEPIIYMRSNSMVIVYLSEFTPGIKKIIIRGATLNNVSTLNIGSYTVINQLNSASNLKFSQNFNMGQLSYDYDTLGAIHSVGIDLGSLNFREIFSKNYTAGKNLGGEGTLFPVITDASFYYNAFAWHRKTSDSSMIMTFKPYSSTSTPPKKRFYLGDSSVNTKTAMCIPMRFGQLLRIKLVWEQKINNKWALVESRSDDFSSEITNTSGEIPEDFKLYQNYPNPFNPATNIKFDIPKDAYVTLKIYDASGKEVNRLVSRQLTAAAYEYSFKASGLSSGIYFYTLSAGTFSQTNKMIILK